MNSRSEEMLTAIAEGSTIDAEPQCRKEQFLKAIANGDATNLPEPICREEELLLQIAQNGTGGGGVDTLQTLVNGRCDMQYLFCNYKGENFDAFKGLDTSCATNASSAFRYCSVPKYNNEFDTSNVTTMTYMFKYHRMEDVTVDASSATTMSEMFAQDSGQKQLKKVTLLNTGKVVNMSKLFQNNEALTDVSIDDMSSVTSTNIFYNCSNIVNLTLKNIKNTLTIGSGTYLGRLLTIDSLVNTVKELRDYSNEETTKTLTMGTVNLEKITDIYVKLVDVTDEMIAADQYAASKLPCEVCESTDEGAMTLETYAGLKNWALA